jgi:hypothetical protein
MPDEMSERRKRAARAVDVDIEAKATVIPGGTEPHDQDTDGDVVPAGASMGSNTR